MDVRAVIFDCDGVLVDTEPLYFAMNREFIRSRGGDFDQAYYSRFIGLSSDLMWSELKSRFELPENVDTLIAIEKKNKALLLRSQELKPIAYVANLLHNLAEKQIRCAVASSGRRENVEIILDRSKLRSFFQAIISGEDVVRGKPAPDIFLKAAAAVNTPVNACIVIEDSHNGVIAAKAAGMYCVGYQNPHSGNQDLSAADLTISDFQDIRLWKLLGLS